MRTIFAIIALAFALALTGPAVAGDVSKATTKADCDKAGGMWDAQNNTCKQKGSDY
jgi:hypothetical protein